MKKILLAFVLVCLLAFVTRANAKGPYFTITTSDITETSTNIGISYSGSKVMSATMEVQDITNSDIAPKYYSYLAENGIIYKKALTGLRQGEEYLVSVSVVFPQTGVPVGDTEDDYKGSYSFTTKGTAPISPGSELNSYFELSITNITDTSATVSATYWGRYVEKTTLNVKAVDNTANPYHNAATYFAENGKTTPSIFTGLKPDTEYLAYTSVDFTPENPIPKGDDSKFYMETYDFTTKPAGTTVAGTGCTTNCDNANQNGSFTLNVRLKNPLKVNTITEAIKLFMNIILKIALPFIVIFFIWSGLKFILALGNATKIAEAKKMFWYTIIGTLLILGAWTITNAIIGTINTLTS